VVRQLEGVLPDRRPRGHPRDPRPLHVNKPNILFYTTKRSGGAVLNSEAGKCLKFV
jgi:predicted phage gp36 major capsid-like protein